MQTIQENVSKPVVVAYLDQSPTIGKLALALAKAQGQMKPATKSADNPFFKSKYADLTAIVESVRPMLAANELAVMQTTDYENDKVILVTTIAHSSGEWKSSRYPILPLKADPQGYGSALTYGRRYSFAAIVGAVAEGEDDDGNHASGNNGAQHSTATSVPADYEEALNRDISPTSLPAAPSDAVSEFRMMVAEATQFTGLSEKESTFIRDQAERIKKYGTDIRVSPAQAKWLAEIVAKRKKPVSYMPEEPPPHLDDDINF